ncbi:hypothetical protein J5Y03_04165 [Bacillus sp. RG28]|uniref:Bacterial Ig domain-containing protein n=1 Tax=Gottfriedia endophytica TaxID=2820819 RepID=A0A940NMQ4_9BACI|nr:Ig-like domain-containing protein [Gottfriedia endophytica]MBP0724380.1 hypothetical protein [Gottfriedia endophytica]
MKKNLIVTLATLLLLIGNVLPALAAGNVTIDFNTDKENYTAQSKILVTGTVLKGTEAGRGTSPTLMLKNESGDPIEVYQWKDSEISSDGTISKTITLGKKLVDGAYVIIISALNTQVSKTIHITGYGSNPTPTPQKELSINTDKFDYKPGEKIELTGTVKSGDLPQSGVDITITFKKNGEKIGADGKVTSVSDGTFHYSYQIPSDTTTGKYLISASLADGSQKEIYVNVESTPAPQKELSFNTNKSDYNSGETVDILGTVKSGNMPQSGVDVTIVVKKDGTKIGADGKATSVSDGTFHYLYQIPSDATSGKYLITASLADGSKKEININVATPAPHYVLNMNTDKGDYKTGDNVKISGNITAGSTLQSDVELIINVEKEGKTIFTDESVKSGKDGKFYYSYKIPATSEAGKYTIKVSLWYDSSTSVSKPINVSINSTPPTPVPDPIPPTPTPDPTPVPIPKPVEAPVPPDVNKVTSESTVITGNAELGTTIAITDKKQLTITGKTDANGHFSISLSNKFKAGTILYATAIKEERLSKETIIEVVEAGDRTTPDAPKVKDLLDIDKFIKGKAEAGSKLTIKVGSQIIATGTADQNGEFSIPIKEQKAGTVLIVTATDSTGNVSKETLVEVKDTTPPEMPSVSRVTYNEISGKAEAGSKITIKVGSQIITTGTTDQNGEFTLSIKEQKAGTVLIVTATDNAGNVSKETFVEVKDTTPPEMPSVSQVTYTEISGKAEADSKITIKVGSQIIATGTVDQNGEFTISIKEQKAGTVLIVTATDSAGNVSKQTRVEVKDTTPPGIPSVKSVTSTKITGKTEPGAKVTIKVGNKIIATGTTDNKGMFSILMKVQKAGTILNVTATDRAGNVSKNTVVVIKDTTPPSIPTISSVTSTKITGKAEAGTTVYVKAGRTIIGVATVNSKGIYSVSFKKQKAGTILSVYAKDKAGNIGKSKMVTVPKK